MIEHLAAGCIDVARDARRHRGLTGIVDDFSPGFSDLSTVFLIGGLPCTTSGAVWLTTFRCVGVPYRPTVSESELTNVRRRSQ